MKTLLRLNLAIWILFSTSLSAQKTDEKATSKTYNSIEEALRNPENVFRLNLSDQKVLLTNEDWKKFTNLEYLNLKNDHLNEIPAGITSLKSLKIIDLSGNDFSELPASFTNLINLEEIYLNEEKNIDLPKSLSLLSSLPKLKTLHLENDNLSILPSEIYKLNNLENLYLNDNNFKKIPALDALNHLKYLDLKNNQIKPQLQDMKNLNFGFKINF
jgi:Leucine-rich repeat (LRR) protein